MPYRRNYMSKPQLIITQKKYQGDKSVISTRLPVELISHIDAIAKETGRTRNDIMQKCLEFAVEHIIFKDDESDK